MTTSNKSDSLQPPEQMKTTPENLIPRPRLNFFIDQILKTMETKDPALAKKIKAIKSRAKGKKEGKVILISNTARTKLNEIVARKIAESIRRSIELMYIQKIGCTITDEVLEQAEQIKIEEKQS